MRSETIATSAIDISDGLLADLGHILEASAAGAELDFAALPIPEVACTYLHETVARDCILAGGDDYELCFTAAAEQREAVLAAGVAGGVSVTRIGTITQARGLVVRGADGQPLQIEKTGYDHFDE